MNTSDAYTHGVLTKLAEHRIDTRAFYRAAINSGHPELIKFANRVLGRATDNAFDIVADAAQRMPGKARAAAGDVVSEAAVPPPRWMPESEDAFRAHMKQDLRSNVDGDAIPLEEVLRRENAARRGEMASHGGIEGVHAQRMKDIREEEVLGGFGGPDSRYASPEHKAYDMRNAPEPVQKDTGWFDARNSGGRKAFGVGAAGGAMGMGAMYGSQDADTTANLMKNISNEHLGTDFETQSRFQQLLDRLG